MVEGWSGGDDAVEADDGVCWKGHLSHRSGVWSVV